MPKSRGIFSLHILVLTRSCIDESESAEELDQVLDDRDHLALVILTSMCRSCMALMVNVSVSANISLAGSISHTNLYFPTRNGKRKMRLNSLDFQ